MEPATASMFLIFTLFSPLWFVLIFLSSCFIICSLEYDNSGGATATFIGTILLLTFLGDLKPIAWIAANPWGFLSIIGLYFVIGAIWGVIKWTFYNYKRLEQYENEKSQFLRNHGVLNTKTVPENLKVDWNKYLTESSIWRISYTVGWGNPKQYKIQIAPIPWENKNRILTWMIYWPWSLLWSLLDDLVRNIFKRIQRMLNSFMEWISHIIFKHVENDYELPPTVDSTKPVE